MPNLPQKVVQLEKELARVQRGQRYAHGGSIENAAINVRDGNGSLRTIVGLQGDGTVGVQVVNGPPPPQPSAPIVASVLGGVTVSWDGLFAGGAVIPLDWQRVEVHASILASYEPIPATLQGTIETAQGATVVVPCDTAVYVRLLARNTSGTASVASAIVGPFGPTPVVANDVLDGIVTTVKLADEAVTAAKVKVGAIGADQLGLGIGNLAPDPSFEGPYTAALADLRTEWTVVTPGNNSGHALHVDCTSGFTTWINLELATFPVLPGERHYIAVDYKTSAGFDGTGAKVLFRYEDATGAVTGYGVADGLTVGGGWERATAQVLAPPNTVSAALLVECSQVTAGEAWFDNVEVRTLIAGGMVAAGSITAAEIAALTINAGNIAAEAINASKIAAAAVTTAKLDALAVTADKIAANAITVGKIQAGAVDATAIAADAITGKTITGGTITGTLFQTATTGERITVNEAGANKVIVYDDTGRAVGELSGRGLLLEGTNGALIWLDPDSTYPNLIFTNDDQSNEAFINVVETDPGSANLGMNCGSFSSGGVDRRWRTYMGGDFWVAERVQVGNDAVNLGGRLLMTGSSVTIGFANSADATQNGNLVLQSGAAQFSNARLVITPPASGNSAFWTDAATGHTGNLLRASVNGTEKFKVDKDGNTTVEGLLNAKSIVTGIINITPSAANTPTSGVVSGLNLPGTVHRAFVTAASTVPGTVNEVTATSVTATGLTVWVSRTNTTTTSIWYLVIAS
jgi:hypothetical protein